MALALALAVAAGCKKEQEAEAVPVETYIRPDTPPSYASPPDREGRPPLTFTDITASAGIDFVHVNGAFGQKWMPETIGSGGAFFDYDGDGRPDVLLINSGYWKGHESAGATPTSRLYRNLGAGRFEDVTESAGLAGSSGYGMGAAVADYDGDGDRDVYITTVGRNQLLRNDGGSFTDVTESAGVGFSTRNEQASDWEWSLGSAWVDYDRDGDLDLFVCNYVQWTPKTDIWATRDGESKAYATPERYPGATSVLFRNNGDGSFGDVSKAAGVYNPDGKSMSVLADDFNDDGWPDLIVTNDTQPNFLYINQQDGTFVDEALFAGVAYDEDGLTRAGMGVSVADVNNAGVRSIVIGNFSGEPLSLYTQQTADAFIDKAGLSRLSKPTTVSLTFGVLFADFNLDGYEDLILANGHIEPEIERVRRDWQFKQAAQLFLNNTRGQFVDISEEVGESFRQRVVGRGVAVADIDADGDLDVLLTANGGSARLLRNDTEDNNVVRVRLIGRGANRDAIGARLRADVGNVTQTRFIRTGGSYLSQCETVATFGLGVAERVDRLRVRWPDGATERFDRLPGGHLHVIEQGAGTVAAEPLEASRARAGPSEHHRPDQAEGSPSS
ncbi:MAG: CRTAC1 family protein [Planctomycetota bacterium]